MFSHDTGTPGLTDPSRVFVRTKQSAESLVHTSTGKKKRNNPTYYPSPKPGTLLSHKRSSGHSDPFGPQRNNRPLIRWHDRMTILETQTKRGMGWSIESLQTADTVRGHRKTLTKRQRTGNPVGSAKDPIRGLTILWDSNRTIVNRPLWSSESVRFSNLSRTRWSATDYPDTSKEHHRGPSRRTHFRLTRKRRRRFPMTSYVIGSVSVVPVEGLISREQGRQLL